MTTTNSAPPAPSDEARLLRDLLDAYEYQQLARQPLPAVGSKTRERMRAAFAGAGVDASALIESLPQPWTGVWSKLEQMVRGAVAPLPVGPEELARWLEPLRRPRVLATGVSLRREEVGPQGRAGVRGFAGWSIVLIEADEPWLDIVLSPPTQNRPRLRVVAWCDATSPGGADAAAEPFVLYDEVPPHDDRPHLRLTLPPGLLWVRQQTPMAIEEVEGVLYAPLHVKRDSSAIDALPVRRVSLTASVLKNLAELLAAFVAVAGGAPRLAMGTRGWEPTLAAGGAPSDPRWMLTAFRHEEQTAALQIDFDSGMTPTLNVIALSPQAIRTAARSFDDLALAETDAVELYTGMLPAGGTLEVTLPEGWRWSEVQATQVPQALDDQGAIWIVLAMEPLQSPNAT